MVLICKIRYCNVHIGRIDMQRLNMGGGKKVLLFRLNRNIITYVYSIIACLLPFHENVGGKNRE